MMWWLSIERCWVLLVGVVIHRVRVSARVLRIMNVARVAEMAIWIAEFTLTATLDLRTSFLCRHVSVSIH